MSGTRVRSARWLLAVVLPSCGLALVLGGSPAARAGGLYLKEFATPAMSAAGAGAEALARDASTAFHNPAGMTRLGSSQLMLGAGVVGGSVEFDPDGANTVPGNDGGNQAGLAGFLGSYYVHDASEDWKVGAGLYGISAGSLDPRSGWVGRYQVTEVDITVLELTSSVAYRVTDWLSLGAALRLDYGLLDEKLAFPGLLGDGEVEFEEFDDWEVGFAAGILLEPTPRTRVGIHYLSEVELDLEGDLKLKGELVGRTASASVDFTMPQAVRVALVQELGPSWTLLATLGWEDWSKLDAQTLAVSGGPSVVLHRGWSDTYSGSIGLHHQLAERWALQAGFAYDSSPAKRSDRSADLPIDRQLRYAAGVEYAWSATTKLGLSFVYADFGKGKIRSTGPLGRTFSGEYERNDLFFLAFHVNWAKLPWSG